MLVYQFKDTNRFGFDKDMVSSPILSWEHFDWSLWETAIKLASCLAEVQQYIIYYKFLKLSGMEVGNNDWLK